MKQVTKLLKGTALHHSRHRNDRDRELNLIKAPLLTDYTHSLTNYTRVFGCVCVHRWCAIMVDVCFFPLPVQAKLNSMWKNAAEIVVGRL